MSRIEARFRALRARGEKALVPFVTAGDPDLPTTEALVVALCAAGYRCDASSSSSSGCAPGSRCRWC